MKIWNEKWTLKHSITSWAWMQNKLWVEIWQWSCSKSCCRAVIVFLSAGPDRNNLVWRELSWPTQIVRAIPQQSVEWAGPSPGARLSGSEMLQPCRHVDAAVSLWWCNSPERNTSHSHRLSVEPLHLRKVAFAKCWSPWKLLCSFACRCNVLDVCIL